MKIVCVGDLHLDCVTGGFDHHDDVRERLYEVDVPYQSVVVQLGDVCDPDRGPLTHRALATFAEWVAHVQDDQSAQVHVLVGNHCGTDDARVSSCLNVLKPWVRVHDRVTSVYEGAPGIQLLMLPWLSRAHGSVDVLALARAEMDRYPGDKFIAFCHLDIPGAVPGTEANMPRLGQLMLPQELIDDPRIERIFAGHIHDRQVIGKVEIVGSLERLGFGERNNQPGYMVIEV